MSEPDRPLGDGAKLAIATSPEPARLRTGADVIGIFSGQKIASVAEQHQATGLVAGSVPVAVAGQQPHDDRAMATKVRDAIATACEERDGLTMAWVADDGSEFIVTGDVSPYSGCKLAASVAASLRERLGTVADDIVGHFLPMQTAMAHGLRHAWSRRST